MELYQLFKVQEIIENKIVELANIEEDVLGKENVFDLRFLALQVKTAEIANLTKCYKYSKIKENIPKDKLFIRYIDALKFLLSIGNIHHFNIISQDSIRILNEEENIIKILSYIFDHITLLKKSITQKDYINALSVYVELFSMYVSLGKNLGFTFEEVYDYYVTHFSNLKISSNS